MGYVSSLNQSHLSPTRENTPSTFTLHFAMMAFLPLTKYTTHMGTSGLKLNILVAGIAACAFWLFGYDMSIMVRYLS